MLHAIIDIEICSVMRLETAVIDVLSVLCYNYSNVVGINYLWLR